MLFFKKNKFLTILLILFTFYIYFNFTRTVDNNLLIDKNNKYYINDLYMSDSYVYNNFLNSREKKLYDLFFYNVKGNKKSISFGLDDFQCADYSDCFSLLGIVNDAILVDHPELMSYSNYSALYKDSTIRVNFEYAVKIPVTQKIAEARIKRIIADIKYDTKDMDDREKIKYVYDWVGKNTDYDLTFTSSSKNQSIYSVFMRKKAVCAGFAKASQVIFQNIGIKSYGVTGNTSGRHMWNVVEYNGKYYFFDSTVASSIYMSSSYYYDGLKQKKMEGYIMDHPEWYPAIEDSELFEKI